MKEKSQLEEKEVRKLMQKEKERERGGDGDKLRKKCRSKH